MTGLTYGMRVKFSDYYKFYKLQSVGFDLNKILLSVFDFMMIAEIKEWVERKKQEPYLKFIGAIK